MKAQEKNLNAAGAVNVEESSDPENGGQNAYLTVYVKGQFEKPDRQALIDRINEIRREACAEGVSGIRDCTVFSTDQLRTGQFGEIPGITGENRLFEIIRIA